jgi:hypothetical protein
MGDDIATCRFSALLVFLVCCTVGCGDSTSPPTCPANSGVDISVSGGLNPTITWAAECGAVEVAVFSPLTGFPVWHLNADTRWIPNPLTYGVVPPGTKVLHTAEALQTGTRYGVYVALLVGTDTFNIVGGFTP